MSKQTILQRGDGEDLFVYCHIGAAYIAQQAKTATTDTVVVELWGAGTSAYRSMIAGYGGWGKYCSDIAKAVGREKFAHECLTTWSAGSEVIKTVCRGTRLPDAIVSLDGIYGTKPVGSKAGDGNVLFDAGLEAIAKYALLAAKGERIFVLLHSAIATPYGSSGECAARIRRYVEEQMGQDMVEDSSVTPADLDKHQFDEALVLGNFHLIEFGGRTGSEHVREAHLFDEVWRKWIPWAMTDSGPVPEQPTGPKPLRVGDKGPEVSAWQLFLRGRGYSIVADGDFGQFTDRATRAFQKSELLPESGVVDLVTLAHAAKHGFGAPVGGPLQPVETRGPEWPPKPDFLPLSGNVARSQVFGGFSFVPAPTPGNPEGIRITDGWDKMNIAMVHIPQLKGVIGAPADCRVPLHKLAAEPARALFERWEKAGLLPLVKSWAGSWAPRFIRGSNTSLSNHAYGSAFDINAAWNGLGVVPALAGRTGSVRELVPIATELGFYWGGFFSGRQDGMHFELAKIGR